MNPIPLPRAHSHNDYWRQSPLMDALECGFCSVEVDIFLREGQLLVGHDPHELRAERTLQSLYLDPLRARARQYRGKIYPDAPFFHLLIDIKTEAEPTYAVLRQVLERYDDLLTRYEGKRVYPRAVRALVSGNRPSLRQLEAERVRFVSYDGRLTDLDKKIEPALMPLISDNWLRLFRWNGGGEFPDEERKRLQQIVQQVEQQGYRLRFWATADRPAVWQVLWDMGVHFLGTDVPFLLRDFMRAQRIP